MTGVGEFVDCGIEELLIIAGEAENAISRACLLIMEERIPGDLSLRIGNRESVPGFLRGLAHCRAQGIDGRSADRIRVPLQDGEKLGVGVEIARDQGLPPRRHPRLYLKAADSAGGRLALVSEEVRNFFGPRCLLAGPLRDRGCRRGGHDSDAYEAHADTLQP